MDERAMRELLAQAIGELSEANLHKALDRPNETAAEYGYSSNWEEELLK